MAVAGKTTFHRSCTGKSKGAILASFEKADIALSVVTVLTLIMFLALLFDPFTLVFREECLRQVWDE
jgi:hypothetical protein